ncbi:MAG: beta-lactamase family protein [Oscillospiraceae bacterium]|jgi:CubicO group peptidase (beta-lactamase class C family)|nr:beta-lactamase family protein [Oscillospiraceae bacterium]
MDKPITLRIVSALLVVLLLAGCNGASRKGTPSKPKPKPKPLVLASKAEELNTKLDEAAKAAGCVGASLVAFENGEITYTHHYGYANKAKKQAPDDQTQYRIASLSKLVTAVTIMKMVDGGIINLDEDISTYLKYQVRNPSHKDTPITMRMLLSHSSSVFDGDSFNKSTGQYMSNKKLLTAKSNFQGYEPGKGYEYSNFGIQAAGAVAELATNAKFHDYARENIFKPMEITAEYLASELEDSSHMAVIYNQNGAVSRSVKQQLGPKRFRPLGELQGVTQSSLTITPGDYAKIIIMLVNGGEYKGTRILSAESAAEILKTQYSDEKVIYCLCVRKNSKLVDGRELYLHSGEAFGILSAFAFDAESKSGAVVVTNGAKTKKDEATGLFTGCRDMLGGIFEYI